MLGVLSDLRHTHIQIQYLMKAECGKVLGVLSENILLQPIQADAKELKHLQRER